MVKSGYMRKTNKICALFLGAILLLGCGAQAERPSETEYPQREEAAYSDEEQQEQTEPEQSSAETALSPDSIPAYEGEPYVVINDNKPFFSETELSTTSYEHYSELDALGRCGVAYACVGMELMPTEERGDIGPVRPSGWHTVKYDVVDGKYLYNRCHLIAYQLSGENANERNLITGTRYLNIEGMLPFENMVADYVRETGNHVMYRVTPIFAGDEPVARGVQMEAESVEDSGAGILFHVYCYNVQPEIEIDYATGDSVLSVAAAEGEPEETVSEKIESVMVWRSATGGKYHRINDCGNMDPNKATQITEEQAVAFGLEKCRRCW